MVQFWRSCPHCRCFWQWTGVIMGTLTILQLHSPICRKLQCTMCSDIFMTWPALRFSAFWTTVVLRHVIRQDSFCSPCASMSLGHLQPWCWFTSCPSLHHFCIPETPHKTCCFGYALTQSSSLHYLALIKITWICSLAHISCFQHRKFNKWLFICCLINPMPWQMPL